MLGIYLVNIETSNEEWLTIAEMTLLPTLEATVSRQVISGI
jgi:hypothetical protein